MRARAAPAPRRERSAPWRAWAMLGWTLVAVGSAAPCAEAARGRRPQPRFPNARTPGYAGATPPNCRSAAAQRRATFDPLRSSPYRAEADRAPTFRLQLT